MSYNFLSTNIKNTIYRNIIFPVMYGFLTWSVTKREGHRLGVFENRVLRKILGQRENKSRGKGHPCRGTEALHRPYEP